MKKLVIASALALIILSTGQAHQTLPVQKTGLLKPMTGSNQTAIKKELGRPVVRLPTKPKLLRSNPHRFTAIRLADSDPWAVPDDEDIIAVRHRLTVVKQRNWDPDLDISDHARHRLAIARALALAKYREKWG